MPSRLKKAVSEYPDIVLYLSFILSITTAVISSWLLKATSVESFTVAMLVLLTSLVLKLTIQTNSLHAENKQLANNTSLISTHLEIKKASNSPDIDLEVSNRLHELIKSTADATNSINKESQSRIEHIYINTINKQLIQAKEALEQIQSGTLRIIGDEAHTLWRDVVKATQTSFFTTNIFRYQEVLLGSRNTEHSLNVQKEVVERLEKGKFERLFVYDDEMETEVTKIMNKQNGMGIHAWSLKREQFIQHSAGGNWTDKIGSEDFTIIDEQFLYVTVIEEKTGRVKYVDIYRQGAKLSAAIEFANHIRTINRLFDENN